MKREILRKTKTDTEKTTPCRTPARRFLLDFAPISRVALLKAARMGMAWSIALMLSVPTMRAASNQTIGFKATRVLAAAGDARAQYQLARMYEFGEGTSA